MAKGIIVLATTKKGFLTLKSVLERPNYKDYINYVITDREKGVLKDFSYDIEELCKLKNIPCLLKTEFEKKFNNENLKNFVLIAIGWKWIIDYPEVYIIHDSILPKYRGFIPLVNMLINGEKVIGASLIKGTKDFDRGEIILQKSIAIEYPIKINDAIEKIAPIYIELSKFLINSIISNKEIRGIPQNEKVATYSAWRDEYDYFINWAWSSDKILRFIDAVDFPYKGAASYINGNKLVRILSAEKYPDLVIESFEDHTGKILFYDGDYPVVICGSGMIKITSILDDETREPLAIKRLKIRFTNYKFG
jgi:methionyl-tRNA formyltransferase